MDFEFGRGRRYDSSSSRESSPQPRKKLRPSSPSSDIDDDDTEIPPIINDDTPPPPERPLIRQAVAFGSSAAPTVPTYQAKLPQPSAKVQVLQYLPGQAPVNPPKQKKRKKKNDEFKAQSGRFRLEAYNPTPAPQLYPQRHPQPQLLYSNIPAAAPAFNRFSVQQRSESPAGVGYSSSTATASDSHAPTTKGKAARKRVSRQQSAPTHHVVNPSFMVQPTPPQPSQLPQPPETNMPAMTQSDRFSHYRRDYEAGADPSQPRQPSGNVVPMAYSEFSAANVREAEPPSPQKIREFAMSNEPKGVRNGVKMVTILAQDIRSGVTDCQLIEVKVPLRPADNPKDGFWAAAQELVEQWQQSAARIDGPARVYTLRGKYRQVLLRVDASNRDEYASVNVAVHRDRTLDVVIEPLPTPGLPPPPPQIPKDLLPPEAQPGPIPIQVQRIEVERIPEPSTSQLKESSESPPPLEDTTRKGSSSPVRRRAPSETYDDLDEVDFRMVTAPTSKPTSPRQEGRVGAAYSGRIIEQGHIPPEHPSAPFRAKPDRRGYESPDSDTEPDKVDSSIQKATEVLISKDPEWKNFIRWKSNGLPPASNMVSQYRFVRRMLDDNVGQPAPFRTRRNFIIEQRHILTALHPIDEDRNDVDAEGAEKYLKNMSETLDLLDLYGREGKRCEDADIIKLLDDNSTPAYNAKPVKRLRHMLSDIHTKWKIEHSDNEDHERNATISRAISPSMDD
ncbi:hypothetical protein FA15DRAFT_476916 [Coprinopsis marcescibilis]|uniref:Uncharacterized protein n=1 Tax=Coprinopsis marcescibilis TaxID=230819 RepID=A0A5C3KRE2_COPMA|nr:hypothetical protein FA15DRAFT_476916 [Coprinopsis marcescibilis]